MTKNQLIKKLQKIEGNPQIVLYNGWVPVELIDEIIEENGGIVNE